MKGQSYNLSGVIGFLKSLSTPKLFVPHLKVPIQDIQSIPFLELKQNGFKAIVFDKDNTITAPYINQIHEPFQESWEECKRVFGSNIVIVSNSAGSKDDVDEKEANIVEDALLVPVLRHSQKKPDGAHQLPAHFNCKGHEIIVVGDRVCTDIVYGNRIGALTILCTSIISLKNDNWIASKIRSLEYKGLWILEKFQIQSLTQPLWKIKDK